MFRQEDKPSQSEYCFDCAKVRKVLVRSRYIRRTPFAILQLNDDFSSDLGNLYHRAVFQHNVRSVGVWRILRSYEQSLPNLYFAFLIGKCVFTLRT